MSWTLLLSLALAQSPLVDAGRPVEGAPVALIVTTPCVDSVAWLGWAETLEGHGFDAWWAVVPPGVGGVEEAVEVLAVAVAELVADRGPVVVAAHGYGGVLALLAELPASRWAFVGTPLGPQAAPTIARAEAGPVARGLPWSGDLVGDLPPALCSGALARAYVDWGVDFPTYVTPSEPVLLLASDLDVVAPPETVRPPSRDWPGRVWHRVGLQSLRLHDPSHAELLLDDHVAERVADFLSEAL